MHPSARRDAVLLRHPLNTLGWLSAIETLTLFLPLRAAYFVSDVITTTVYVAGARLRGILNRGAAAALGSDPDNPACRRTGWAMLRHHGYVIVDYMLMARSPRRAVHALIREAPDDGPLRRALARGRGALLVSVHLGHYELGGALLASLGHRIHVVTGSPPDSAVERHRVATRAKSGIATLHMALDGGGALDLLPLLAILRRNEVIALLADRPGSRDRVGVPYLGRTMVFPAGPALLSYLTGAPLVPSIFLRRPGGTYAGELLDPVVPDPARPRDGEIARLTGRIAQAFEPWVRAHPEQWYNLTGHGI